MTGTMAPRATRRQAVLSFDLLKFLFVLCDPELPLLTHGSISSNQTMSGAMKFSSISVVRIKGEERRSTRRISMRDNSDVDDVTETAFGKLRVSFWIDSTPDPIYKVEVYAPLPWTAKIYLGALHLSIRRRNLVLSLTESEQIVMGHDGTTQQEIGDNRGFIRVLNEVHWLFSGSLQQTNSILEQQNVFLLVHGGGYDGN